MYNSSNQREIHARVDNVISEQKMLRASLLFYGYNLSSPTELEKLILYDRENNLTTLAMGIFMFFMISNDIMANKKTPLKKQRQFSDIEIGDILKDAKFRDILFDMVHHKAVYDAIHDKTIQEIYLLTCFDDLLRIYAHLCEIYNITLTPLLCKNTKYRVVYQASVDIKDEPELLYNLLSIVIACQNIANIFDDLMSSKNG